MRRMMLLIALLALLALACGGSSTVSDPNINNKRMNGFAPIQVYESPAYYSTRSYQIICYIEPFKYFTTDESDLMLPAWRRVAASDGSCSGWAVVR